MTNPSDSLLQSLANPDINPFADPGLFDGLRRFFSPAQGWQNALGWTMDTNPQAPGVGHAQQMAAQYGDSPTAASTVGVKSQKAQKIKKAKSPVQGGDIYIDSTPSTRDPKQDRNEIQNLRNRYSEMRGSSST